MRKVVVVFAAIVCMLMIVPLASSQFTTGTITTSVDKDFMVGNIHTATSRMYVHNKNTLETVSVFTRDIDEKDKAPTADKLVFRQDGDQRALHQVWSEQVGHVHDIVHGTEVKELAQK